MQVGAYLLIIQGGNDLGGCPLDNLQRADDEEEGGWEDPGNW